MSIKEVISTDQAPQAIGTYSQAIRYGQQLYVSGQIPLNPTTGELEMSSIEDEIHQVFKNLKAIANAAGTDLNNTIKLGVFLTDLSHFAKLNEIMAEYFQAPYPARAAVEVKGLPKGVTVEMEAIIAIEN